MKSPQPKQIIDLIKESHYSTINEMNGCLETASQNLSDKICESCQKNIEIPMNKSNRLTLNGLVSMKV